MTPESRSSRFESSRTRGLTLALAIGLLLSAAGAQAQFPAAIDIGELPPGKSIVITYQAQIEDPLTVSASSVQDQGLFDGTNFTAVLTDDPDTPAPDDPTVTPLDTPIDLQVSKTESADPVAAGGIGNLTYVVSVFNDGPGNGTGVTVSEVLTLPPGVSIDSITPSIGSYAPANDPNGTWTFDVANQATETLTVVLTVGAATAPGTDVVSDTATVTGANQDLIMTGDDTATESTSVTTEADLSITKTDSPDPVVAGTPLIYTVTVENLGPSNALGVVVTDTLPAGVSNPMTIGCVEDTGGTPTCTLGTINAGTSKQYTITVDVDSDTIGAITNDASVASSTSDPDTGNNTVSEDTTTQAEADLSITKTDSPDPVIAGGQLTYTVTVENLGPSDASGVIVTDTLPAGVSNPTTVGCVEDSGGTPTCTLGVITAGTSKQYTITVDVDAGTLGVITNSAAVSSDASDPNGANDNVSEDTTVTAEADLSITKTDDLDPILPGETLTYTVTVQNAGPSAATNVVVTDTLPAGPVFVQTVGCAEDPGGVPTCTLGTIPASGSAQYTIEVSIPSSGMPHTLTNQASVSTDATDPVPGNDSTSEDTLLELGDYGDAPDPLVATAGEYPTLVANDGARHIVPAAGAPLILGQVIDTEPDGQPSAGADGDDNDGTDDEDGVVFVELQQGQTASVNVTVTGTAGLLNAWIDFNQNGVLTDTGEQVFIDTAVTPGLQTLTYPVPATAGLGDTYARFRLDVGGGLAPTGRALDGEVEDYVVTVVPPPALSLTKDDGGVTALPGGIIAYTLTAGNAAGSGTAFDVTLTDTVPTGTTFNEAVSGGAGAWSCPDGSPSGTVCTRTLADIPGGDSVASPFAVTVDDPLAVGINQIDNTASLDASNSAPVPASDSTPVDAAPDLEITKDDGGISGFPGGVIPYTLDVVNNGNQGATDVEVSDTVPDDTVFDEAASGGAGVWSCADGSPAGTVCVHSVGALEGGGLGTASVTFAVTVDNPYTGDGFVDNTAEVADDGTNGSDQNPADNSDSDSTPVALDFGDAPPPYPTLFGDDGARHVDAGGLNLGALIDIEVDGLPTPGADGDDTTNLDDEDGVVFASPTIAGTDVDVEITASAAGLLNAWIDFNADGDWTDAGEQVFTDQAMAAGLNSLVVAFPTDAEPGDTFSRWRISSAGGDGLTGLANDGEVEDHALAMLAEADLVLEKEDVWDPRMAGQPQTYVLTVTNDGPSLARATEFEDTFPPQTEFIAVEPGAPMCTGAAGVITCELGDLAAGEEMEVRFDVFIDPTFAGTMINDASATSTTLDPDPSNNDATEDTTILALMDLETLPDINDNGSSEVAVLEAGSLKFTVVDGDSGDVISSDTFQPDFVPIAMSTVPHFAGLGMAPELAILAKRPTDGAVSVFLRDSRTGEPLREHVLSPDYTPLYLESVPNFGDSAADELAILGRRLTDNMPRVFIHDADTGTLIRAFNYPQPYFPLDLELVPDFTGGGVPELAVPGRRATDRAVLVTIKDAATAATATQWFSDHTFLPISVGLVPAWDGGVDRMSILGRRSTDGAVRLFVRKVTDGTRDVLYGHPLDFLPVDLEILIDFAGPVADESSVLRWRPSDGDGRSSQKDSSDGSFVSGMRVDPTYFPLDLEIQPDWIQTLADELAVLGIRLTDGDLKVFLFDGNGAQLGTLSVP